MKELGAYLKEVRKSHGVSLEEASEDLKFSILELENMESGNIKAFKDVYHLRHMLQEYAKYLGLNKEDVTEEFNDFLFEHTSKISLEDIVEARRLKEEDDKKVVSPYTTVHKRKINFAPFILGTMIAIFVLLLVVIIIKEVNKEPVRTSELKGSVSSEYTY